MGPTKYFFGVITLVVLCSAEMNINIKQPNAEVYHQQSARNDQFNYGYHVNTESNQFQHKVKGPDDVTYGCYGYVDPTNQKHLVYYVADRMGYRIIFPNRPTKIFTQRVSDSLNKLDGSLKGKEYDEKVVAWNDLYLPDSCFRLGDILSSSASTVQQQVVQPPVPATSSHVRPVYPQPGLPQPTQYTIPTAVPNTGNQVFQQPGQIYDSNNALSSEDIQATENYDVVLNSSPASWSGSLPDINPAHINLDQFDIRGSSVRNEEPRGSGPQGPQQFGLNITQLLAQIETVNSQVVTLNMLLAGMANNPAVFSSANEGSCKSVLQLLRTQKTTPQLVYVPILIPYVEGQHNVNQPSVVGTPQRIQQRPCHQCDKY
ncbi:uncharacterized protein LOC128738166 isoform X2 [Sabethes cyaneus]|uniref:uncharacterized protein LOC128738166 isoform X2 n=1 Tax=Sabethes cyaneus TaxID=53552 RepID=UPI00237E737C|nr:uncharacterized protein LOC128738166 isoform X2 [Sabethes cyaneus]